MAAYLDYKPPSAKSHDTEAAITAMVSAAPTTARPALLDTSGWESRPTSQGAQHG